MKKEEIEKEEELNTYEKGNGFEHEFALFMKQQLDWSNVRVGAHMAGKQNVKGANIDVIGERLDDKGTAARKVVIAMVTIASLMLMYAIIWAAEEMDNGGLGFLITSFSFLFGSIIFGFVSAKYNKENAWVECKNLKGKANINHISKTIREIEDYRASGNSEYKFTHHYFASANGFVENALKYAVSHNIICYEKEGNTFKRVGYWD